MVEAKELARYLRNHGAAAEGFDDMTAGVEKALGQAGADGVVLCFGWLYSIGDIKASLDELKSNG